MEMTSFLSLISVTIFSGNTRLFDSWRLVDGNGGEWEPNAVVDATPKHLPINNTLVLVYLRVLCKLYMNSRT